MNLLIRGHWNRLVSSLCWDLGGGGFSEILSWSKLLFGKMFTDGQHNEKAWDDLVREGTAFANPAQPEDFREPEKIINPFGWLPARLSGLRVLCLAAGGGRHGPVFAAQGAVVSVFDISEEMLRLDEEVARRERVTLTTVKGDMTDLSNFGDAVFDIVLQPVSSCYVDSLEGMYSEVARVMKAGGTYVSQHKQPISLQASIVPGTGGRYHIEEPYYRSGTLPQVEGSEHREVGTREYLHRLEDLLGGMCRAGFAIEDLKEPRHGDPNALKGTFAARSCFVPPYVAIKATRNSEAKQSALLWTPATSRS